MLHLSINPLLDLEGWRSPPISLCLISSPILSRFEGPALPVTSLAVLDKTQLPAWLPPSIKWGLLIFSPSALSSLSVPRSLIYSFACSKYDKLCKSSTTLHGASLPKRWSLRSSGMTWESKKCDLLLSFFFSCLLCMLFLGCFTSQMPGECDDLKGFFQP